MEKEKDGVWRTIRGRRIFIASGQSLSEALNKSGKFNKRVDRTEIKRDVMEDTMSKKMSRKVAPAYTITNNQAPKNRINENTETQKYWQKRVLKNYGKYSETDKREIAHENLQKRLADYKANKELPSGQTIAEKEKMDKFSREYKERDYRNKQRAKQVIAEYKAKKQSNNKIDDKQNDYTFTKTGGNNYFTTERVDKDGDMVGQIETHDRDVKKPYYVAWKPKDENLKYSPNGKWETKSFDTKEEALNYLKDKQSNSSFDNKFVEKAKALYDRDGGKISEEEYYKKLAEIDGLDFEKEKAKMKANLDRLGVEKPDFLKEKQSNNKVDKEYHFAGEELYSDDPHRYDDTIKSAQARKEKFKADENFKKEKHIGWGSYNKDGVPVYENDIDYKGDFGWANLKTLSDDDLTKALNIQSEEYHKANAESVGDRRTRNGRMDKIFKDAKVGKYEQGMKKISEEMQKRDMPRYNIYDKKNPNNILVSSPTKEMADRQIQDMYKTDISLQKEYGWKELPKYEYKVGKVDENLNEIKETIRKYKKRKGK